MIHFFSLDSKSIVVPEREAWRNT